MATKGYGESVRDLPRAPKWPPYVGDPLVAGESDQCNTRNTPRFVGLPSSCWLGGHADHLPKGGDPEHHPFALDLRPVRSAAILVGEPVYVISRLLSLRLPYDFPAHLDEAIRVLPIPDRQCHPGIALGVPELLAVNLGVDQEAIVVGIDPHHLGLWVATWQQRRERCEVTTAGQLYDLRMEPLAILVVSHALASSVRRS